MKPIRWPARPTTYRGVAMRSRLEAAWAANLEARGLTWAYEPRCFADQTGQYLPDFQVEDIEFWEVKPAIDRTDIANIADRVGIIWSSEPTARLVIVFGYPTDEFNEVWLGIGGQWDDGSDLGLVRP